MACGCSGTASDEAFVFATADPAQERTIRGNGRVYHFTESAPRLAIAAADVGLFESLAGFRIERAEGRGG